MVPFIHWVSQIQKYYFTFRAYTEENDLSSHLHTSEPHCEVPCYRSFIIKGPNQTQTHSFTYAIRHLTSNKSMRTVCGRHYPQCRGHRIPAQNSRIPLMQNCFELSVSQAAVNKHRYFPCPQNSPIVTEVNNKHRQNPAVCV